jgi:hypothetical protein
MRKGGGGDGELQQYLVNGTSEKNVWQGFTGMPVNPRPPPRAQQLL